MINLTRSLPSRRTTEGRVKERGREGSSAAQLSLLAWTIVSPETKLKNAPLAPRQPHRSSCSVSSTEWNSLPTKEGESYFFFHRAFEKREREPTKFARSFSLFLSLFFFLHPSRVLRQGCRTIRVSSTFCLLSGSAAFFLECPPPFRYVSRDPQKTSTPRTRNLISFSRLVTATTPRAGILRPTNLLFFQRERRRKGNVQRESPSQKPPSDNVFSPAIILPFRFVIFAPPLLETNLYIRRRNSGQKEKERNKVFWRRRVSSKNIAKFRSRVIRAAVNKWLDATTDTGIQTWPDCVFSWVEEIRWRVAGSTSGEVTRWATTAKLRAGHARDRAWPRRVCQSQTTLKVKYCARGGRARISLPRIHPR